VHDAAYEPYYTFWGSTPRGCMFHDVAGSFLQSLGPTTK